MFLINNIYYLFSSELAKDQQAIEGYTDSTQQIE